MLISRHANSAFLHAVGVAAIDSQKGMGRWHLFSAHASPSGR